MDCEFFFIELYWLKIGFISLQTRWINSTVLWKTGNFLTPCVTISFKSRVQSPWTEYTERTSRRTIHTWSLATKQHIESLIKTHNNWVSPMYSSVNKWCPVTGSFSPIYTHTHTHTHTRTRTRTVCGFVVVNGCGSFREDALSDIPPHLVITEHTDNTKPLIPHFFWKHTSIELKRSVSYMFKKTCFHCYLR